MKPTLILLVLLAVFPSSSTAQVAQDVPDFAACERCVAARGCPSDFNSCFQNCQRPIQQGQTTNQQGQSTNQTANRQGQIANQQGPTATQQQQAAIAAAAIESCIEECSRQLDRCLDVARLGCASVRECL